MQRRKARKQALELLYAHEITDRKIRLIAEDMQIGDEKLVFQEFAFYIAERVIENAGELDRIIERYADDWKIDRLPVVDKNIIRIGVYELLFEQETPVSVAINEAVELGKKFGSADTAKFVNGMLGKIALDKEKLLAEIKSEKVKFDRR